MSDHDLEHLNFRPGELIFAQGDLGDTAYLVESGKVEIAVGDGKAEMVINIVNAGEMFGEMALIDRAPRMASARAMAKTTVVVIPKKAFEGMLKNSSPMLVAVIRTLLDRLRQGGKKAANSTL